jgi:hypothetical protein
VPRMMEIILKNFEKTYKVVKVRVWKKLWRKGTLPSWNTTDSYILVLWWDSHPVESGVQQLTAWWVLEMASKKICFGLQLVWHEKKY